MKEIESIQEFDDCINQNKSFVKLAFQGLDLRSYSKIFSEKKFENCLFLGCTLKKTTYLSLVKAGNTVFPKFNTKFKVFRNKLYTRDDLYDNFDRKYPVSYKKTTDFIINEYYNKTGRNNSQNIYESLVKRLHDHSITDALYDFLEEWNDERKIVAIMGGHNLSRNSKEYRNVAIIAKKLSEIGYLLLSGGGPGGMEATHLGAWFAYRSEKDLDAALQILAKAPNYKDEWWLSKAFEVIEKFPQIYKVDSVGIPTWFYGHEPPVAFATQIAKYFANSVREEGLLAIAKGGIVFAPGDAGTIQEVFQEAAQNHYASYGNVSPMVFLNKDYWKKEKPVFPLLTKLAYGKKYANFLSIRNNPDKVVQDILAFSCIAAD